MRSPGSGSGSRTLRAAVAALVFVLVATLTWAGAAIADSSGNSAATITGSFSDGCRDFTSRATRLASQQGKDISYVELHHADGRIVKNETITRPDYAIDGEPGDELDVAKAGDGGRLLDLRQHFGLVGRGCPDAQRSAHPRSPTRTRVSHPDPTNTRVSHPDADVGCVREDGSPLSPERSRIMPSKDVTHLDLAGCSG